MFSTRRSVPARSVAGLVFIAAFLAACTTTPPQPQPQPKPQPKPAPQPQPPVKMPPPVAPVPSQQPPAPLFTPVAFEVLPGWQQDDLRQAWPAFLASCRALAAKPDWKIPCATSKLVDAGDGVAIRQFFDRISCPTWCAPRMAPTPA